MKTRNILFFLTLAAIILGSCSSTPRSVTDTATTTDTIAQIMEFRADSAYSFVKTQCDFGPRVPNTSAHRSCADYLADKLKSYGAQVTVQPAEITAYDGTTLHARNIIGEFAPEKSKRILLLAHWDSRPWADCDPDSKNHKKPVPGANDGASGVGVLLEMARLFSLKQPDMGVDILFVDAEDWGDSSGTSPDSEMTWALGTQYWLNNPHRQGYRPVYGILLDMVGARGSKFAHEYYSTQYAPALLKKVWDIAARSGYSDFFVQQSGGAITDDHVFINRAGIPTIDIIAMDRTSETGFFPQWHTIDDTMEHIAPETLKAVGQTLTNLIYTH